MSLNFIVWVVIVWAEGSILDQRQRSKGEGTKYIMHPGTLPVITDIEEEKLLHFIDVNLDLGLN